MRTAPLRFALGFSVMLLATVAACGKKDTAADSTVASPDSTKGATATLADQPTELPVLLADMKKDDWINHLKTVPFDAKLVSTAIERTCEISGEHSKQCSLRFTPVKNTLKFSHGAVPKNGAILGRVENLGDETEKTFGIPAHHNVLWVVVADRSYLIDETGETFIDNTPGVVRKFVLCHNKVPQAANAGFYYCWNSPGATKDPKMMPKDTMPFTDHTRPPWVTCAEGCCNIDGDLMKK